MRIRLRGRREDGADDEHDDVWRKLNAQERTQRDHARRLRAIETELNIYKPSPLERTED